MYLFSRTRRINTARGRAAMAKSVEIAARVSEISGYTISAWTTVFSPDFGTVRWTCRVEHLAELESINDKLAVSEDFGNLVEEADHLYSGPLEDSLVQLISADAILLCAGLFFTKSFVLGNELHARSSV